MVKEGLCAAVESAMQVRSTWQSRAGEQAVAELTALRERFHSGSLGAKPYVVARLTLDIAKTRGINLPSEKVLVAWLRSKD